MNDSTIRFHEIASPTLKIRYKTTSKTSKPQEIHKGVQTQTKKEAAKNMS